MNPLHLIANCFYIGKIPHLGTSIATLIGLISGYYIYSLYGEMILLIATIVTFFLGLACASHYLKTAGEAREVVIDEIVGTWVVLVLAFHFGYASEPETYIAAFIAFRLFDGIKLWPIDLIEQGSDGAFGSMIDDAISGVYAFMGLAVMLFFYNALLT